MPYTDQEKQKLIELISKSGLPIKKACKQYGISDASFYAWRKKLAADVEKKQEPDQSETEHSNNIEAVEKLLALKEEHPYYGVVKLSKQLLRTYGLNLHPGKVKRVLEEHGFKTETLAKAPPKGTRRFERLNPCELWMMDIMYYRLKKEGRFYLVSILDDYSRFIVAHKVCTTQNADNVTLVFQEAVEQYGLPNQHVCTKYGISRETFYQWEARIKEAATGGPGGQASGAEGPGSRTRGKGPGKETRRA